MGQGINSKIAGLGAGIPLLMRDEIDAGRLVPGSLVAMVAFGAGLGLSIQGRHPVGKRACSAPAIED